MTYNSSNIFGLGHCLFIHSSICSFFYSVSASFTNSFHFSPCYSHPLCSNPALSTISSIWPASGHLFPLPIYFQPYIPAFFHLHGNCALSAVVFHHWLPVFFCLFACLFFDLLLVFCRPCLLLAPFAFYLPACCWPLSVLWHCLLFTPAWFCLASFAIKVNCLWIPEVMHLSSIFSKVWHTVVRFVCVEALLSSNVWKTT